MGGSKEEKKVKELATAKRHDRKRRKSHFDDERSADGALRGALLGLLVGAVFRFSGAYLTAGAFGRKWTDVIDVSLGLSRS